MDSFEEDTTADVIIANKKLCHFNVENIELKFEHLMIGDDVDDKKRSKFRLKNERILSNPFGKRKW